MVKFEMDEFVERDDRDEVMRMAAEIVAAYLSFNAVPAAEIPDLIQTVHRALFDVRDGEQPTMRADVPKPAVPIRKSIQDDFLICLEDGKKLKMLKRYLRTKFNLTPEEYRVKWGLPADYPMVAPNYSRQRSSFAKNIGLGRRREDR